jgi:C_GCAxxG_C_C family probable redox protein
MERIDQALQCFKESFNCSQAIVSAYGPGLGLDRDKSLRASAAFGGGIARMGETCGAVTGAMMVIGLAYGRTKPEDKEAAEETNRVALAFLERFKARHFTVLCRELLGCDVSAPEGKEYAKKHNVHDQLCAGFVKTAAEILEELLSGKGSTPA